MAKKKLHASNLDLDEISPVMQRALGNIAKLERQRAALNAKIKVERDAVYAAGIDRATLAYVKARFEMDPADRQLADEAQIVAAKAAGIPIAVQSDLFNHIEEAEPIEAGDDDDAGGEEKKTAGWRRRANGQAAQDEGAEARA